MPGAGRPGGPLTLSRLCAAFPRRLVDVRAGSARGRDAGRARLGHRRARRADAGVALTSSRVLLAAAIAVAPVAGLAATIGDGPCAGAIGDAGRNP